MDNDDRKHLSRALTWAHRTFAGLSILTAIMVAIYISASLWDRAVLPNPLNAFLFVGLVGSALGAFVTKEMGRLRLEARDQGTKLAAVVAQQSDALAALAAEHRDALDTMATELSRREGRIYTIMARCEMAWRTNGYREEITEPIPTPPQRTPAVASLYLASTFVAARSSPVPAGAVAMSQTTVVQAKNRRRSRTRRSNTRQQRPAGPVPQEYLTDMSEAVELGRQIEAERRRRGPSSSDPEV